MTDNIIAGLVSGVLATFIVFVFTKLWTCQIIPWFENRVYKDVRIEGTWFSLYPTTVGERQETVSIERHGHEVKGTIICTTADADQGERYNLSGSFRNMILTLAYETEDQQKTDRGTITLKCVKNGERLKGKIAIYHDRTDSIDVCDILWFRSREDLSLVLSDVRKKDEQMKQLRERAIEAAKEMRIIAESPSASEERGNQANSEESLSDKEAKNSESTGA